MKPTEILETLINGTKVKVKENAFKKLVEGVYNIPNNEFTVYQIENGSVNLYNELTEEVFYEILFDDLIFFAENKN
jgi:serine phosphatase RsbU (regulator of sigma subunit)